MQRISNSLADTIEGQQKEQSIFYIGVTPLTNICTHMAEGVGHLRRFYPELQQLLEHDAYERQPRRR